MRRGGALVLLLCVGLAGCLSGDHVQPSTWLDRLRSPRAALGPDGVLIDLVLMERPLGDPYLNEELWHCTDCQVVDLEHKSILDDNGFRVGQVVGMLPAKLQTWLNNDRWSIDRLHRILPAGTSTTFPLGPTLDHCTFRLNSESGPTDVSLDQGQCMFTIQPSLTNDGRTRLTFTPQVQYGAVLPHYQVAEDRSGRMLEFKRSSKTYDAVSWDVTLAPNEFLVIGTFFDENASEDAPQTMGGQFFIQDNGRTFVQRVLIVRTTRGTEQ
jgi:hypothetical protein